jgi:hypothetical protein
MILYLVIDCEFNRNWHPELINTLHSIPPSYLIVKQIIK